MYVFDKKKICSLLRSESPSGKCAKLHTDSKQHRDHAPRSLYYCLFAPHIYGVLRAHPARGKSHIQRNANREVATDHNVHQLIFRNRFFVLKKFSMLDGSHVDEFMIWHVFKCIFTYPVHRYAFLPLFFCIVYLFYLTLNRRILLLFLLHVKRLQLKIDLC